MLYRQEGRSAAAAIQLESEPGTDLASSQAGEAHRPAIYVNSLAAGRGAERVIYNLLTSFAKEGKSVDLLIEDGEGELFAALQRQAPQVRIQFLRGGNWQERLSWLTCWLALAAELLSGLASGQRLADFKACAIMAEKERPPLFALRRYLKREQPVTILSFLNDANIALMLAACLGKNGTRFIPNVRNHISAGANALKSKRMRAMSGAMRRLFRRADRVVVPAEDLRQDVAEITGIAPERIERILNPIDLAAVEKQAAESPEHPWLDPKENTPVVLAAGKLKPQKDFPTLLKAFAELRARRDCRLVLLGSGPLENDLRKQAKTLGITDDISFQGHVDNPFAYLARAQVFVLSSAWEGLPNVLIEALACGCPVVSTDCPGGASEILEAGRHGRLVPVGDAAAMAEAIQATLEASPPAEALRARAADFSIERAVEAYAKLLFPAEAAPSDEVSR